MFSPFSPFILIKAVSPDIKFEDVSRYTYVHFNVIFSNNIRGIRCREKDCANLTLGGHKYSDLALQV
jgi:hypothetical protein